MLGSKPGKGQLCYDSWLLAVLILGKSSFKMQATAFSLLNVCAKLEEDNTALMSLSEFWSGSCKIDITHSSSLEGSGEPLPKVPLVGLTP